MKEIKLQDIAARCGCSITTVSRVINGQARKCRIGARTAERVMAEEFEKHIVCDPGTGMAQMGIPINGRAADIHSRMPGIHGLENLFRAGKGICEEKCSHSGYKGTKIFLIIRH